MIQVNQLSLWFDRVENPVLDKISFQLNQGETMLLLGPSGSGKSTLTFCLNGIYPRELDGKMEGSVQVSGQSVNDTPPGEISKQVGVVFQDPESQFCMLTVEDEIAFGLENIHTPQVEMEQKITEVLQLVNLSRYRKAAIHSLSGGQKQKVALACVLALQPDFLILDEPTANLDPLAKQDFIKTMKHIQQEKNISLMVIEHQLEGWVAFIERAYILSKDGRCMYDGSLMEAMKHKQQQIQSQGISLPPVTELVLEAASHQQATYTRLPLTNEDFLANVSYLDRYYLERKMFLDVPNEKIILASSNLYLSKNKQEILHNITFQLFHPSFVAITGANGSGKTSLLRLLAGIDRPTSGKIHLNGRLLETWKESTLRQQIGYVFQNPEHQFITDNVYDEIAYTLRLRSFSESKIKERVHEIVTSCQLNGLENYHPYSLSQGQKRRLSVATMIVDEQHILFLDEPTFGQDTASLHQLMQLLRGRHQAGTTIMMITHDMELVDQYADRVIVLANGKIVADKTPDQLWDMPHLENWHLDYPTRIKLKQQMEEQDNAYVIK